MSKTPIDLNPAATVFLDGHSSVHFVKADRNLSAPPKKTERRGAEAQLVLDFQKVVRCYAPSGVLFASQSALAMALKSQYPWITANVVARLIRQDQTLLRIGDYKQGVHGVPHLVLSIPSRLSIARRKTIALKMLQRLVEKRKKMDSKPLRAESTRYGRAYRQQRAFWTGKLIFGPLCCTRCGRAVKHGKALHLDHHDGSDIEIAGWAHPVCNLRHQWRARLANWYRPTFFSPDLV